jgi:hypothetical protein
MTKHERSEHSSGQPAARKGRIGDYSYSATGLPYDLGNAYTPIRIKALWLGKYDEIPPTKTLYGYFADLHAKDERNPSPEEVMTDPRYDADQAAKYDALAIEFNGRLADLAEKKDAGGIETYLKKFGDLFEPENDEKTETSISPEEDSA